MGNSRRPAPPDFDQRVTRLIELEQGMERMKKRYDDELIRLLVVDRAPITTIAERLQMTSQAVSYRRRAALKRRADAA